MSEWANERWANKQIPTPGDLPLLAIFENGPIAADEVYLFISIPIQFGAAKFSFSK